MTDLWTNAQVAQHLGVSESRARHILADNGIKRVYGYPADAVQAIQRPGQGARTDLKGSTMTGTDLYDWGSYFSTYTLEDSITNFLGEFRDSYDYEGLADAYRAAINERLAPSGIILAGKLFTSQTYPAPEDSSDLIRQAVEDVDLGEIAVKFDRS